MKLTREKILRDALEMASHNLNCYSENLLCTKPKEGYEKQFKETIEEIEMLKTWLKEFHRTNIDSTIEFIGHITVIKYGKTYDNKPLANELHFEVDTGASYLYGDQRIFEIASEVQDWFIGENGCCGKYDVEKDSRSSRRVKITVDHINYVRAIEWNDPNERE